jgi:hypothetical protein
MNGMNRLRTVLAMICLIGSIGAAIAADSGILGRIDTTRFPKPRVIWSKPVIIERRASSGSKPIYLHVPPGVESHWHANCHAYDACATPVYFVTEGWFRNVYLPAIGSRDGREQRYRTEVARERASERDLHDQDGHD